MLQCVAICCSALQCIAVSDSQHTHTHTEGVKNVNSYLMKSFKRVAVCCRVLQYVAGCCSVLQGVAGCCSMMQGVAVCCRALQCCRV